MSAQSLVHRILVWAPPAICGGIVAVAGVWDQARDWIAAQTASAWSQLNPYSATLILIAAAGYVVACIWTSPELVRRREEASRGDPLKITPSSTTLRDYEGNVLVDTVVIAANTGDDPLSFSIRHAYVTRDANGQESIEICADDDGIRYLRRHYPEHLVEFLAPRVLDNPHRLEGKSSLRGSVLTVQLRVGKSYFADRLVALVVDDHTRSLRQILVPGEHEPRILSRQTSPGR